MSYILMMAVILFAQDAVKVLTGNTWGIATDVVNVWIGRLTILLGNAIATDLTQYMYPLQRVARG